MKLKHHEVFGDRKEGLFFEISIFFNDNKSIGERGYYLDLVPVELSEDGMLISRHSEVSKRVMVIKTRKESETKLKEAIHILDKEKQNTLKTIKENPEIASMHKIYKNISKDNFGLFGDISSGNKNDIPGIMNKIKGEDKVFKAEKKPSVRFEDVAGLKEVKEELYEIVDSVKNKEKYEKMGAKLPRGILLYGPPGTGKTYIGKALAGETNSKFFYVTGSEFTEKYVGVGAKRVRDLFEKARKESPSIIFIDEIDAIGGKRSSESNNEKDQTLNQILTEMDGFKDTSDVIVIGATNRIELLDSALKRAGRFDKHIYLGNPDLESRKELFKIHTKNKPLDEGVDLDNLAKKTHGFSGADIENIANESALIAIRENRENISQNNMEDALEKVIGGLKSRSTKLREQEKQIVSYHEAGHALIGIKLGINKVQKISIIPHGQALGFVINLPEEDKFLSTKSDLEDELKMILAGRVAEEVKFGYYSTGASNDLQKATKIALNMVCRYGMNEDTGLMVREVSSIDKLTDIERASVNKILNQAYEETKKMLTEDMPRLSKMAEYLIENEEMDTEDLETLFKDDLEMVSFMGI